MIWLRRHRLAIGLAVLTLVVVLLVIGLVAGRGKTPVQGTPPPTQPAHATPPVLTPAASR